MSNCPRIDNIGGLKAMGFQKWVCPVPAAGPDKGPVKHRPVRIPWQCQAIIREKTILLFPNFYQGFTSAHLVNG